MILKCTLDDDVIIYYYMSSALQWDQIKLKVSIFRQASVAHGVAVRGWPYTVVHTEMSHDTDWRCILYWHSKSPEEEPLWLWLNPAPFTRFSNTQCNFSKSIEWNGANFGTHAHGSQRMTLHNCGDTLILIYCHQLTFLNSNWGLPWNGNFSSS